MDIYYDTRTALRLWRFVQSVSTEIGGMGYARILDDGDILWHEVFLCPQVVSKTEVDFEELGGDAYAIEKAVRDGVLSDPQFLWVSWHSHNSMSCGWSPTDDARIEALRGAGVNHVLSVVCNHKREYVARYDAFHVDHHGCVIPQVTMDRLSLAADPAEEIVEEIQLEIDEMVQLAKPAVKAPVVVSSHRQAGTTTTPSRPASPWTEQPLELTVGDGLYDDWED